MIESIVNEFIELVVVNGSSEISAKRKGDCSFEIVIGNSYIETANYKTNNIDNVISYFLQLAIDESNKCHLQLSMTVTEESSDICTVEFKSTKKNN